MSAGNGGPLPQTGWRGAPCPACSAPLRPRAEAVRASEEHYSLILSCPAGHCWEERICARTLYSSVLVHRRAELEGRGPRLGQRRPSASV